MVHTRAIESIESIESRAHSYLPHSLVGSFGMNCFLGGQVAMDVLQWSENAHFNMACATGPSVNMTSKIELKCDKTRLF
jgi:hypothetical protein